MGDELPKVAVSGVDAEGVAELARELAGRFAVEASADRGWSRVVMAAQGDAVAVVAAGDAPGVEAGAPAGVLWRNEAFLALDAWVAERALGVARAEAELALRRARGGEASSVAGSCPELSTADGARTYEAFVSGLAAGPQKRWAAAAVCLRDVTAVRRSRSRRAAVESAGAELLRMDADSLRRLNAMERLAQVEKRIVRATSEVLHFDHFAIRLLDDRTGKLELVVKHNLPPEFDAFEIYASPEGNGISGYVAATGIAYICRDTSKDELFLPGLTGARSSLTVPLKVHDRVIGIMDIESQRAEAFTEEDLELAEAFARYVALALHVLNLLVVERSSTSQTLTGRVEGEVAGPLQDICNEVEILARSGELDAETRRHLERIRLDVDSIRQRVREVASGPQTLLGVERAMEEAAPDPMLEGRRVLVADDAAKIRRIIGDVLRSRGCEVTLVEGGVQAIAELQAAAKPGGVEFDLVISDIMMPDANGYEVFAAARASGRKAPVILMTGFGYDPHHSIVRASQEGLQSVLFKPFQVDRLLEECRKALAGA
ncbi:MAG: response regulator [Phycisphaerae bacterium]|nr:response regulator [Phycisphaerae bacterium]